jgi:hypothetical protein
MTWKPPKKRPLKGLKIAANDQHGSDLEELQAAVSEADLKNWFVYHAPREGQAGRYELLRAQGHVLATLIYELTPPGPDQSVAIRKVREAIMTANAAIACEHEVQTSHYHRKVEAAKVDRMTKQIFGEDPKK